RGIADCYHGEYDTLAVHDGIAEIAWSDDRRSTATGPNPDVYAARVRAVDGDVLEALPTLLRCDDVLQVSWWSALAEGPHSVTLRASSGDTGSRELSAGGRSPGEFVGSMSARSGVAASGDGVLQLRAADSIRIAAVGVSTPRSIQVNVDCTPPHFRA